MTNIFSNQLSQYTPYKNSSDFISIKTIEGDPLNIVLRDFLYRKDRARFRRAIKSALPEDLILDKITAINKEHMPTFILGPIEEVHKVFET